MRPAPSSTRLLSIFAALCVATVVAVACSVGQARVGGVGERAMAAARSATAPAPAPVASSDPPIDPDIGINNITHVIVIMQENRSFDHYFGTFPGADGFPRDAQGHIDVCVPDPQAGICRRPYHDTNRFDAGGPHGLLGSSIDENGDADGRVRQGAGADRQRMPAPPRRLPVPGGQAGSGGPAGHHGVSHRTARSRTTGHTRSTSCCRTTCSRRSRRGRFPRTCSWCRAGRPRAPTSATR